MTRHQYEISVCCRPKTSFRGERRIPHKMSVFLRLQIQLNLIVFFQTEAIIGGFKTDLTAQQVLSLLANFSRPVSNNFRRPNEIYGGDLVIAVNILLRLADYNSNQGSVSSAEDVNNYVQVASNLLDSVNSKTWQNLERVSCLAWKKARPIIL